MKIAAGCFGCLAFIFLILTVLTGTIVAALLPMMPSDVQATLGGMTAYIQYLNSGCCCMSGVLAIILFAVGSMRSREPIE